MVKYAKNVAASIRLGTIVLVTLVVSACGGNGTTGTVSNSTVLPLGTPAVKSFTPTTAVAGVPTVFTVVGSSVPLKAKVDVPGGTCASPTNTTATGFSVVCTPGSSVGFVTAVVYTDELASGGWWMGQQTLGIVALPVAVSLLTDTGISANQCYGAGSDELVNCASAAALALNARQDGMLGRDVDTPDSTDGLLGLAYGFSAVECVKDKVTGLIWQRASTTLVALPGDTQNQEAASYRGAANTAALCGFTDWRLPSPSELQSLVNYGSSNPLFAIDLNWFAQTRSTWYLTATQFASGNSSNVWAVDFSKGRVAGIGATSGNLELRLVR